MARKTLVYIFVMIVMFGCQEKNDKDAILESDNNAEKLTTEVVNPTPNLVNDLPDVFGEWTINSNNDGNMLIVIDNALYIKPREGEMSLISEDVMPNHIYVSPNRKFVAYLETNENQETSLHTFNLNNSDTHTLLSVSNEVIWISWSPDSDWISLISAESNNFDSRNFIGMLATTSSFYLVKFDGTTSFDLDEFPSLVVWSNTSDLLVNAGSVNGIPEKFIQITPQDDNLDIENLEVGLLYRNNVREGIYSPSHRAQTDEALAPLNIELPSLDDSDSFVINKLGDSDSFAINKTDTKYVELFIQTNKGCIDYHIVQKQLNEPSIPNLLYQSTALMVSDLHFQSDEAIIFVEDTSASCDDNDAIRKLLLVDMAGQVEIIHENLVRTVGNQYALFDDGEYLIAPVYNENGEPILIEYDFTTNEYMPIASLQSYSIQVIHWIYGSDEKN